MPLPHFTPNIIRLITNSIEKNNFYLKKSDSQTKN